MATQKAQRIGIWIIAIVLTVGTLAGFVAIVLAPKNQAADQTKIAALTAQYQTAQADYQKKVDAQSASLSTLYFADLNQYSTLPAAFNKDDVKSLTTQDLKVGDGADITASSTFSAYYIGWNPSGVVFDESISGSTLKAPFSVTPGGVIQGWTDGTVGMKVGGIRELTIPSDKAYGATGSGANIPANTPLKFVIMIIPTPDAIAQPAVPAELEKYYTTGSL
ncbi:MAG: putative Peptidylprolyl isomerase [Candidatus Saccharibacteria bacterium]|nr:putative Peptidylprolyl isomerase [Candidatus Saccharibacteria bacterium]